MRKIVVFAALILGTATAHAQTGTIQGYSVLGGTPAQLQGMSATNYQQGIIPGATITVYLTGTSTLATIYSNGSGGSLSNPFTSVVATSPNAGYFLFWAAEGQGYDVVASGGGSNPSCTTTPNCYAAPQTILTDVFVSLTGGGGGSGITQLTGDVTAGPGSGSVTATLVTVNSSPGSYGCANITVNGKGLVTSAAGASCITGSGTTDYVPLWTGTNALGNSLIDQSVTKSGWITVTGQTQVLIPAGDTQINAFGVQIGTTAIGDELPPGDFRFFVGSPGSGNLQALLETGQGTPLVVQDDNPSEDTLAVFTGPNSTGWNQGVHLIETTGPFNTGNGIDYYYNEAVGWTGPGFPPTATPYGSIGIWGEPRALTFTASKTYLPQVATSQSTSPICPNGDTFGALTTSGCSGGGSSAFSAITSGTNTGAAMLVGSGASLAPTGTGTIQATDIASTISPGTNVTISGSGTVASPYVINASGGGGALPSCTADQLIYYASSGTTGSCLTLGTNLSITSSTLNASGGGGTVDVLSPDRATGTPGYSKLEWLAVGGGSTTHLLNLASGDGYVTSLEIIANDNSQSDVLNFYYNGDSTADVSIPVYMLCMSVYGQNGNFYSNYAIQLNMSSTSQRGCVLKLPIPFASGIKIDYVSGTSSTIWSDVEYQTGVPDTWPNTRKLHIDALTTYGSGSGVAPFTPVTFDQYAGGPGRFIGLWWQDDAVPNSVSSYPGPLEGNIRYYTDAMSTTWTASTAVSLGATIVDSNGNLETVTTAGTTGSTQPTWNYLNSTTADGTAVWTESPGDPTSTWKASEAYTGFHGSVSVLDTNGNVEMATTFGTSGSSVPSWSASVLGTTTDGSVTWTNVGSSYTLAAIQSSGTEDWFGFGFDFGGACKNQWTGGTNSGNSTQICSGYNTLERGVTFLGSVQYATNSGYRLHIFDKQNFSDGFSLLWQNGDSSENNFTGNPLIWATVYYYTEN